MTIEKWESVTCLNYSALTGQGISIYISFTILLRARYWYSVNIIGYWLCMASLDQGFNDNFIIHDQ